ncbi:hypothetical protein CTAYLR_000677 [Chrysophaeum taylorii]|uniref:tRNA(Ile)-lysidine synthetase n=1 Tax=Chrysophaeum taylorii TaxID=2483200 RepID=A0AAD7U8T7_9STRA|nr:hypothetical protein CTAYLR_000677 [Chrysophaeum taylorii]
MRVGASLIGLAQRWMPASECSALLEFWFASEARERWFSSTVAFDRVVAERWGPSLERWRGLEDVEEEMVGGISAEPAEQLLAHVVLWDQVSRHCARVEAAESLVEATAPLAVATSRRLLESAAADEWDTARQCFVLLPLRHTFEPEVIEECLRHARRWRELPGADDKAWRRFETASIRALCRANTALIEAEKGVSPEWWRFGDVLEAVPEGIEAAWEQRYADRSASLAAYATLRRKLRDRAESRFVVSVSGGVDSMVLLYLAARLGAPVVAAHVDYGNRARSRTEADFVASFCAELGVPLYRRNVSELQRGCIAREDYEDITRETRFGLYKKAGGDEDYAVVLGHNRNDARENLFTNVNKGQHYDELRGMREDAVEQGVRTWRPLLEVPKSDIYEAAAAFRVPHCRDSTDPACERGRLRDDWLPLVFEKQPLLVPGLERLADHLSFLHAAWRRQLDDFWETKATTLEDGRVIEMPVEPWMLRDSSSTSSSSSEMLWVDVFTLKLNEGGRRPSNRSLANFAAWLSRAAARRQEKKKSCFCELSRDWRAEYVPQENGGGTLRLLRRRLLLLH